MKIRNCRICHRIVLLDEWETKERELCVFCQAEYGEKEKEEGQEDESRMDGSIGEVE